MEVNYEVDKLGIIKGQIADFTRIEASADTPLNLLRIIESQLDAAEELGWGKFIDLGIIAQLWVQELNHDKCDIICAAIEDKYSNRCIYLDHSFREWKVTDLFSSMINIFCMAALLSEFDINEGLEYKGYINPIDNGYNSALILTTPGSRVSFDNRGIRFQKDICFEDLQSVSLKVARSEVTSLYCPFLFLVDGIGQDYRISLPLIGFKTLFEEELIENSDTNKIKSISIYGVDDYASIIE